jgi:hypothetical protein
MPALVPACWSTGARSRVFQTAVSLIAAGPSLPLLSAAWCRMVSPTCVTKCCDLTPLQGGRGRLPAARAAGAQPVRAVRAALCCCPPADRRLPIQGRCAAVLACAAATPAGGEAVCMLAALNLLRTSATQQAPTLPVFPASKTCLRRLTLGADCGKQGVPAHKHRQPQGGERPLGSEVLRARPARQEEPEVCMFLACGRCPVVGRGVSPDPLLPPSPDHCCPKEQARCRHQAAGQSVIA